MQKSVKDLTDKQVYITELEANLQSAVETIELFSRREMDVKLFLTLQEIFEELKQYSSDLNELNESVDEVQMRFKPSQKLTDFFASSFPIGTIDIQSLKPEIQPVSDIEYPISFENVPRTAESSHTKMRNDDVPAETTASFQQPNAENMDPSSLKFSNRKYMSGAKEEAKIEKDPCTKSEKNASQASAGKASVAVKVDSIKTYRI